MLHVPLNVTREFRNPIAVVLRRQLESVAAVMPMPEATMNKDHLAKTRKDKVGRSSQFADVKAVTITSSVNQSPYNHLWSGVAFLDPRHAFRK